MYVQVVLHNFYFFFLLLFCCSRSIARSIEYQQRHYIFLSLRKEKNAISSITHTQSGCEWTKKYRRVKCMLLRFATETQNNNNNKKKLEQTQHKTVVKWKNIPVEKWESERASEWVHKAKRRRQPQQTSNTWNEKLKWV